MSGRQLSIGNPDALSNARFTVPFMFLGSGKGSSLFQYGIQGSDASCERRSDPRTKPH
jgi:hypothetical protein